MKTSWTSIPFESVDMQRYSLLPFWHIIFAIVSSKLPVWSEVTSQGIYLNIRNSIQLFLILILSTSLLPSLQLLSCQLSFALPPLLLIAYPTIKFQKILGCYRWPALHIFADIFHSCYKNITDSRIDYSYLAALYFILSTAFCHVSWMNAAVYIIGSLLFALLHPIKKDLLNI